MTAALALPRRRPLDEPRPLLRVVTEADLFRGMSRPDPGPEPDPALAPVPCACGTDVAYTTDEAVPLVVARHNATIAHQAWRAQQEP